jgi:hypothetical protein
MVFLYEMQDLIRVPIGLHISITTKWTLTLEWNNGMWWFGQRYDIKSHM